MYKMLTPKIQMKVIVIILVVWLFAVFGVQQCFAVSLLNKSLNKIEKNIDDSSSKKAVVKDIYKSALNKSYYDQLNTLSDTVSELKMLVNQRYFCNLNDTDITNILYYENVSFKRDVDLMSISTITKPTTNDMKDSCSKFNLCIWSLNWQLWDVSTYWCLEKISGLYGDIQSNKKSVDTLTNKVKWNEYFWNGSLEDSTYDLLLDVYDIAKILFGEDTAVKPPEIVFFDMPQLNNVDEVYSEQMVTVVDRFAPYNTTVPQSNATTNTSPSWLGNGLWKGGGNLSLSNAWWSNSTTVSNESNNVWQIDNTDTNKVNNNLTQWMDVDIMNFIQTVNTVEVESENVATVSMWNQCVSGFSYQFKTWYTITDTGVQVVWSEVEQEEIEMTVEEYVADVLDQIHALQCNNDYICDNWESTTCPDCMQTASWTTVLAEMEDLMNSLVMEWWDEVSEQTVACMTNCWQTQTTPEAKLLCVAKCRCKTYESKQFDPSVYPGLSPIFKLKFCVIPATQVESPNVKIARSVQTVVDKLYDLLSDLRNGWSTMPAVKTKTYLDSSYMKNSFARNISFLVTSTTKKHTSQPSQKTKEKNQEDVNNELSSNLAWFSQDPTSIDEKNKYIVAQTPYQWKWVEVLSFGDQIHESLENSIIISVDDRFDNFMELNSNFWKNVKDILDEFNTQSKILNDKR